MLKDKMRKLTWKASRLLSARLHGGQEMQQALTPQTSTLNCQCFRRLGKGGEPSLNRTACKGYTEFWHRIWAPDPLALPLRAALPVSHLLFLGLCSSLSDLMWVCPDLYSGFHISCSRGYMKDGWFAFHPGWLQWPSRSGDSPYTSKGCPSPL